FAQHSPQAPQSTLVGVGHVSHDFDHRPLGWLRPATHLFGAKVAYQASDDGRSRAHRLENFIVEVNSHMRSPIPSCLAGWSCFPECGVQVRDDVVDTLDANRQADEPIVYPSRQSAFARHRRISHRGRMLDERRDIAKRNTESTQSHCVHEPTRLIETTQLN